MTFNFTCEAKKFSSFIDSILAVGNEGWIEIKNDGLYSMGLNLSNTIFVKSKLIINIEGEPSKLALDIRRIEGILPSTGEIKVSYDGSTVIIVAGKSKYKFIPFAPGTVREPKDILVGRKFLYTIEGVVSSDLYDSLKSIESYNIARYYKCILEYEDGNLVLRDPDSAVITSISHIDIDNVPSFEIHLSSDLLLDIISYLKKNYSELSLSVTSDEEPIVLSAGKITVYAIAPRVKVD